MIFNNDHANKCLEKQKEHKLRIMKEALAYYEEIGYTVVLKSDLYNGHSAPKNIPQIAEIENASDNIDDNEFKTLFKRGALTEWTIIAIQSFKNSEFTTLSIIEFMNEKKIKSLAKCKSLAISVILGKLVDKGKIIKISHARGCIPAIYKNKTL